MIGLSKHAVAAGDLFDFTYQCEKCGHAAPASIVGEAIGSATTLGLGAGPLSFDIDSQGTTERAQAKAQEGTGRDAKASLKLVPCPKCGGSDTSKYVAIRLLAVFAVAAAIIIPTLLFVPAEERETRWILFGLAALGAIVSVYSIFDRVGRARRAVVFSD